MGLLTSNIPAMQAACNFVHPALKLMYSVANPSIYKITTDGAVTVKSISGGVPKSVTYPDGISDATLAVEADANTTISIMGYVKSFTLSYYGTGTEKIVSFVAKKQTLLESLLLYNGLGGIGDTLKVLDISSCLSLTSLECKYCTGLTSLDLSQSTALTNLHCTSCIGLTSLDLSQNTELSRLHCNSCTGLTSLNLSQNTALTILECGSCAGLTSLDLSQNTALTILKCGSCAGLANIKFRAIEQTPSARIASAITAATSTTGTVYLNSADQYYSTVADAATAKGWTIQPLV